MITVKIDAFEGPLDLLLHLIEKAEVDIYDISVSEITDQYVAYIRQMQNLELEIASEYLVMAASLLAMKSKLLLPKQPLLEEELEEWEEIDPRAELIERLIEYKKYKELAHSLRDKELQRHQLFTRPAENLSIFMEREDPNPVENVSLFDLLDAFEQVLTSKREPASAKLDREEISIEQRIEHIKLLLQNQGEIPFTQLFKGERKREVIVVTFLALLEMMKRKWIACRQKSLYSEIWITSLVEEQ